MNDLLWHYTVGTNVDLILACGELRPTSVRIERGEAPALWFSTEPFWEPTATKGVVTPHGARNATLQEMDVRGGGLYRLGVNPPVAPHDWKSFVRISGISPGGASRLRKAGKAVGADHYRWFCSFDPVGREHWRCLQRLDLCARRWIEISGEIGRWADVGSQRFDGMLDRDQNGVDAGRVPTASDLVHSWDVGRDPKVPGMKG